MILIKVIGFVDRFVDKCIRNGIGIEIINREKDVIMVKILENDLERTKKLNYYSKIEIVRQYGWKHLIYIFKNNLFDFSMIIFAIISLYFVSNIIVRVDIKHENKELVNKVNDILKEYHIERFSFRKDYDNLNSISDEILRNNRDFLDWISINREGMHYIVSFEERVLRNIENEDRFCNIVAKRDGVVKKIVNNKGAALVERNQLVHRGDQLISGSIYLGEELKGNVCAEGEVYSETWYTINISMPIVSENKSYSGKCKYNIAFNQNYLFKNKYEKYDKKVLFKIGSFKFLKNCEYSYVTKKLSAADALNEAIDKGISSLLKQIGEKSEIIEKKVLKENINNSKIELEVFVIVNESIGVYEYWK